MKIDVILKTVRKELNISQETLAHELSVSFTTLNRWENGRSKPSRLAMIQIKDYCKHKGVSDELLSALNQT
jgi:DNA-binding transcriptional regulator YiaG